MFWNFVLIYGTLLAPLALYGQPFGDFGLRVRRVHEPISVRRTEVGTHMDSGRMHGNPYPFPARHDTRRTSAAHISSPLEPRRRFIMPGVIPIGGTIRTGGMIRTGGIIPQGGGFPMGGMIRTGGIIPQGGVIPMGGMIRTGGGIIPQGGVIPMGGMIRTSGMIPQGGIISPGGMIHRPGTSSRTVSTVDRHVDGAFGHGSPHPIPSVHTERRTVNVRHGDPGISIIPPVRPRLVQGRDRGTVVSSVHIPMVAAGTTAHVDQRGQHGHEGETPAMHVETRWAAPPGLEHLLENPVPPHVPARRTRMRVVESAHVDRQYEHGSPHARPSVHVERHLVREDAPVRRW